MDELNDTTEIWKDVPGWDGMFQVSNFGHVRRMSGKTHSRRTHSYPREVTPRVTENGYSTIRLDEHWTAHALVATVFIGPKPSSNMVCNHKNGVKSDNRPENLEWITYKENSQHAVEMGLMAVGKKHWTNINPESMNPAKGEDHYTKRYPEKIRVGSRSPNAKLNEGQVLDIKIRLKNGEIAADIAKRYGVTTGNICCIANNRTWRHVIISSLKG